MPGEFGEFEVFSKANEFSRDGSSRTDRTEGIVHGSEEQQYFLASDGDRSAGTNELAYSGYEPNLVSTSHEIYLMKPEVRTKNDRRHHRIPARKTQACIKTEGGENVIVNLVDISRGGACFTSYVNFQPGTPVLIATHYIEGGQNIFQLGRIVRVQHRAMATLPGEFAVEFSLKSTM